jgi:hypothetical protein
MISDYPRWLSGFAQRTLFRRKPYSSATQYKYIHEQLVSYDCSADVI